MYWKLRVVTMPTLSSLVALAVVGITTFGSSNDDNIGIMMDLGFQWWELPFIMTSSNGNISSLLSLGAENPPVTSDVFWSSVWTTVEQTLEWPVIRDAMTSIWRHHNVLSPVRVQMATDLESVTNNVTYVILKHFKGSHTTPPNKWQFLSKRGNTIIWWGEIRIINQICLVVLTVWRLPATQWLCIMYIFNA